MPRQVLRFFRYPGLSLRVTRHRFLFWSGAVAVALAAILFAKTSVLGNSLFATAIKAHPYLAFVITPAAFAGIASMAVLGNYTYFGHTDATLNLTEAWRPVLTCGIGAGLGSNVAHLLPGVPVGAMIILGMVGYFTGVVQALITAVVIVMEMTDDQTLVIPLIALGASRIVCSSPLYRTLAKAYLVVGI